MQAQAAIAAGRVLVGGAVAERAARLVSPGEPLEITEPSRRFVSRGGDKLEAALEHFAVEVGGARALDAGASTGGFTDCLLQRGAASVVALDVGHGQLDDRLRRDGRVLVLERLNLRDATPALLAERGVVGDPFDVVVADLSFISLARVLPRLTALSRPGADLVLLVKPQFEASRAEVSKGRGVVRDPEVWRQALRRVGHAAGEAGAAIMGVMGSPISGASGNREFLVHARSQEPGGGLSEEMIDRAVAEVAERPAPARR